MMILDRNIIMLYLVVLTITMILDEVSKIIVI